ncbi:hypothetical protein BC832DRAFT_305806 [Gaertneriomyces semiglobifer]|nr:hypothetical protein BC832DRAFT_305806 [Gaertneriomyces semiglobifer]
MTAATTKEGSVEPTYDYHGGPPPPAADEKVVVTPSEEKDVKEAVIHETVAALEREEVQPVIERERIHTEIQQVVQPVLDVVNEAPVVESKELPEETHRYREKVKEDDVARYEAQAEAFCDETHQTQVVHEKVFKEPVIHEVVHTKIITEVQPVIERVVHKTHIVEETQPIKETFVKAPVVHEQEIAPPLTMEDFEKLQRNQKRSP